ISQLLIKSGRREEGVRRLHALSSANSQLDADAVLVLADSLVPLGDWETVVHFLDPHLARFPDDYRILYLYSLAQLEEKSWAEARAGFVRLLDWPQERILRQAPSNPSSQISNYFYGPVPDEAQDFLSAVMENRARHYIQKLQIRGSSGAFQHLQWGNAIVNLPANVEEARMFSITQLRQLSRIAEPAHLDGLTQEMMDQGVADAELLMELPILIYGKPMGFHKAIELFKEQDEPHLGLVILVTGNAAIKIAEPFGFEVSVLESCYDQLAATFPEYALTAALCAAVAQPAATSDGHALLSRAFDELPTIDFPSGHLQTAFSRAINVIHIDQAAQLTKLVVEWSKNDRTFLTFTQIADVLKRHADVDEFVEYLQRRQLHYQSLNTTTLIAPNIPIFSGPIVKELEFPPQELPGYASEVLIEMGPSSDPNYSVIDLGALAEILDEIEDPVIKALAAKKARAHEQLQLTIEQLASRERLLPGHQLLIAAYYGSIGDEEQVVEILEAFRKRPMTAQYRQKIDGAIVAHGLRASPEGSAFESAKSAALRLSYSA
ncbi:MAG: hypothetical protein AAF585_29350, partial [Verrucomicrobiota bacterium]